MRMSELGEAVLGGREKPGTFLARTALLLRFVIHVDSAHRRPPHLGDSSPSPFVPAARQDAPPRGGQDGAATYVRSGAEGEAGRADPYRDRRRGNCRRVPSL